MKKKLIAAIVLLFSFFGFLFFENQAKTYYPPQKEYHRIVILSDAHYPSKLSSEENATGRQTKIENKLKTINDINGWNDVDLVVFPGDIVEKLGNEADYSKAKEFVDKLTKAKALIVGNHEFMYDDSLTTNGKLKWASPELRAAKLERFKNTFRVNDLYYSRYIDNYLLIFLSPDVTNGKYLTEISAQQLSWLEKTLDANKTRPTLIFFHAPLAGTLASYNKDANTANFVAQPEKQLHDLLMSNPQILLWASGHTHTPATNPSFAAAINFYEGKILNLHNPTLDGKIIWTNSIYLYPNKIFIRTFNHTTGEFIESLDRTIPVNF
ncbi:MAG: metallophosphoesterase [Acidaminococcaceae bacterium]